MTTLPYHALTANPTYPAGFAKLSLPCSRSKCHGTLGERLNFIAAFRTRPVGIGTPFELRALGQPHRASHMSSPT